MNASGNVLGKADVIKWAMSGDIKRDQVRVLFESEKLVSHKDLLHIMMKILRL
jgi:hypothetical protein